MPNQHAVAIVDDVAASRSIAALLERADYKVRTFASCDAFLAAQAPGEWDCVVLDMHTPGINGIGLLKALGAAESMTPVLVLTGQGAIAEAVEAMKLGAVDFLEKPYPAETFLEALGRALASGPRRKGPTIDSDAVARIAALSQRQIEVLRGILKGQPNKIIAYELSLSIRTVEAYRAQLLERLGVRGTAAAVRLAVAAGMLETI
jgi:two-component system response regulator FixJ